MRKRKPKESRADYLAAWMGEQGISSWFAFRLRTGVGGSTLTKLKDGDEIGAPLAKRLAEHVGCDWKEVVDP